MKFYEAIRLGAMIKPQCYRRLYDDYSGGTCAAGAALDAIGRLSLKSSICDVFVLFPFTVALAPRLEKVIGEIVVDLNDEKHWTREQIADWLQPLEDAWWAEQEAKWTREQIATYIQPLEDAYWKAQAKAESIDGQPAELVNV